MTKPCCVPKCKTGYKSVKLKCSVFKAPTNVERRKKWQAAIPGIKQLSSSQYVCEKHFDKQYIHRKYVKQDASGKIIAEVSFCLLNSFDTANCIFVSAFIKCDTIIFSFKIEFPEKLFQNILSLFLFSC